MTFSSIFLILFSENKQQITKANHTTKNKSELLEMYYVFYSTFNLQGCMQNIHSNSPYIIQQEEIVTYLHE